MTSPSADKKHNKPGSGGQGSPSPLSERDDDDQVLEAMLEGQVILSDQVGTDKLQNESFPSQPNNKTGRVGGKPKPKVPQIPNFDKLAFKDF